MLHSFSTCQCLEPMDCLQQFLELMMNQRVTDCCKSDTPSGLKLSVEDANVLVRVCTDSPPPSCPWSWRPHIIHGSLYPAGHCVLSPVLHGDLLGAAEVCCHHYVYRQQGLRVLANCCDVRSSLVVLTKANKHKHEKGFSMLVEMSLVEPADCGSTPSSNRPCGSASGSACRIINVHKLSNSLSADALRRAKSIAGEF